MKLSPLSLALSVALAAPTFANAAEETWVVMDGSIYSEINTAMRADTTAQMNQVKNYRGMSIAKVDTVKLAQLTGVMHKTLNRCGGFSSHSSLAEAEAAVNAALNPATAKLVAVEYSIDNQNTVNPMIADVDPAEIVSTISHLSSYTNRFYKTNHGKVSAEWIKDNWAGMTASRPDMTAELYQHPNWGQPSVILTIEGSTNPDEVVVMGGHLDSTVGNTSEDSIAPGADDDASGIAVLTEAVRIMVKNGYKPKRTLKIMGYAAEEAGLLGSKEIAKDYANQGVNVVGVIQFDMTNFHGSAKDLYIYTDYTNNAQNAFIADLVEAYQNVTVGESKCGYGCSDHASWNNQGFPSSFPFESVFGEHNKKIHTAHDTLENSDSSGATSVPFAVLALSYAGELAKGELGYEPPPPPEDEVVTETFNGSVGWRQVVQLGSFDGKAGTGVSVTMTGTNDADLYVKVGSEPTTSNWDCRPYINGSVESCKLFVPATGEDVYVMVRGYSWSNSSYKIDVTYTTNK